MLGCDPSHCTLCAQNRLLVQVQGVLRRSALGAQQRSARCATHPSPCPCPCPCHWRGLWTWRSLDFGLVRLGTRTRLCELGEWVIGRFVCCHSFVRRPGPGNFGVLRCTVGIFFFFFFGVRARFGGLRLTYSALYVICTLDGTAHNFCFKNLKITVNILPWGGRENKQLAESALVGLRYALRQAPPVVSFARSRALHGGRIPCSPSFLHVPLETNCRNPVVTVLYVNFCKGLLSDRLLACVSLRLVASRTVDLFPPPQPRVLGFVFWGADWGCRAPLIIKIRCESRLL